MEKLQPKLRFPEFKSSWLNKTFIEIVTFINGKAYKQEELLEKGKYPVLRVGNFFSNNNWYYSDLELDEDKYCDYGDLLYAWSASFGPKIWDGDKTIYHYHIWKVLIKENNYKSFIYHLLDNETLKMKNKSANGFALLHITKGTIESWNINIPSLQEQTRIANFLSSVDEKINLLKEKKSLLEDYKKGIMQKIFNQELRFKDDNGNDFEDWETKKIKEVFKFKQGIQCGVENQFLEKSDDMVRFIRIIDLTNSNEPIRYIKSVGDDNVLNKDDLFMVRYGNAGLVGYGYEGTIANNLFRIIPITNVINKFYYYVFVFLEKELSNLAGSSTMPALNFSSLSLLNIPFVSTKEQTKIANFLSALDEKIELVSNQIQDTQEYKKGLLQQMFV